MAQEVKANSDPRHGFVPRRLPWLVAAVMLVVYLATVNPWVSLSSLIRVAGVAGWSWQAQLSNPLVYLVTLPFRLAPAGALPLALNIFSAVCAAATLGLLARCVAILPHDRLENERRRERSDFSFLTGRFAAIPPVVAAGLLGCQLSFWERATNFTGESFELLWFAAILWQLLEYRLDEAPRRLYLAALGFGAGLAEHWAFAAWFPLFLTALIWIRGRDFFNLRFLARLFWSGVAGGLLIFLLPLIALGSGRYSINLWEALRPSLGMDGYVVRLVGSGWAWRQLGLVSVGTLLPLLVLSIRWSANFGDTSGVARALLNYLFYLGNLGFLAVCAWVMFDPPFSPKSLSLAGSSGLTLYYAAALSLGYFCGSTLILFGKKPESSRRNPHRPEPVLPPALMWLCPVVVAGTLTAVAAALVLILAKNAPVIRAENDDTLLKYARLATENLPPGGAILLGDVDAGYLAPVHGYLVEAMLAREGRWSRYPVVDTLSLRYSVYQEFLHRRHPAVWPVWFKPGPPVMFNELGLLRLMNQLARSNTICYLNPSFGYYFESFYQEPHGLWYAMKPLPAATLLPPPLTPELIQENERFWSGVAGAAGPGIAAAVSAPETGRTASPWGRLLDRIHAPVEVNPNAVYAGRLYSVGLDDWGVRLQRAGELELARTNLLAAEQFNPDNMSASLSLGFNHALVSGRIPAIDLERVSPDHFGKSHNWAELLAADGPVDDLSFDYQNALILAGQNGLYRQSIAPLSRVRRLAPDRLDVRLKLANAYLLNHLPSLALEALQEPLAAPARFGLAPGDETAVQTLVAAAWFQEKDYSRGIHLLEQQIERQPGDEKLVAATVQSCIAVGYYTNALQLIDRQLERKPDAPDWVFARGFAELQRGDYAPAITAFTKALTLSTNDPTVRFNRALACLDDGRLADARADYLVLQAGHTNSFQIAYGLGEIAWRQHDTNEAIRNYRIYLANSRTNTAEAATVQARLRALQP